MSAIATATSVESYLNPVLMPLPSREQMVEWLDAAQANHEHTLSSRPIEDPLILEEQQVLLGVLRYIDGFLPADRPRNISKYSQTRLGRLISQEVLAIIPPSNLDVDDLRQLLRLEAIKALRYYRKEFGFSLLSYLGTALVNRTRKAGSRNLSGGLTGGKHPPNPHDTPHEYGPLSRLKETIFQASTESGYSDELAMLEAHPDFYRVISLDYAPRDDTRSEPPLTYGESLLEPVVQVIDESAARQFTEIESISTLDRVFSLLDSYTPKLTDREKLAIRLQYEKDMTQEDIAKDPSFNCTRQHVSAIQIMALKKIRIAGEKAGVRDLLS